MDDLTSSEDLSVFLADLDAIAIRKFDPSLHTPCTKDSLLTKLSVTQGGISLTLTSNNSMTSKTFKDVLCNASQRAKSDGIISWNDFLPSEDLYAVLADMKLGYDSRKPRSQSLLSRCTCTKHEVDDVIERNVVHMKHAQSLVARNKNGQTGIKAFPQRLSCLLRRVL